MVKIDEDQFAYAGELAARRCWRAYDQGKRDTFGLKPKDAMASHFTGVLGEMALAIELGRDPYTLTLDTYKAIPDVGVYEVRAVTWRGGEMPIRDNDPDDRPFVMVAMGRNLTEWTVHGWILGGEAKTHDEWYMTPNKRPPCWWVPQSALNDMSEVWS